MSYKDGLINWRDILGAPPIIRVSLMEFLRII